MNRDLIWGLLLLVSSAYTFLKAVEAATGLARWSFGGLGLILALGGGWLVYEWITSKKR